MIYNPSSYNKAFYLKYRIKNMAVRHDDVAEIYWNIIGNSYRESVGDLKVYLHIPGNTNVRTWAHGPLNGNVTIIDQETILVTISNLSSYRAVDVRATFDLGVINKSTKMTGVNALDKIILYETDKAEQANYERQNEEKLKIQRAEEALSEFEVDVTRYNYEYALKYINSLDDSDIKTEYLNRLEKTKLELDKIEEENARYELKHAKEYLSYSYYELAKESIEILDNQQVKAELLQELLIVENQLREIEIKLEKINYIFGTIFIIIIIGIGYIIYKRIIKDPKTVFNHKYFREIPNDYSPETVSYLFHKKVIDNSMSATLLDLIHRKIIIAKKLSSNNYRLILNEENALVTNVESKLLDLIFNGSATIDTKDMKTKSITNYSGFISRWNSYKRAAEIHAKQQSFYEDDIKLKTSLLFSDSKISREGLITILIFICCFIPGLLLILLLIFGLYFLYKFVRYIVDFIRSLFRTVVNGESIVIQDSKTLYLITVDGRQKNSIGMMQTELAEFLIEKETITGKEFMKIFRKEKGIPEPEEEKKDDGTEAEANKCESSADVAGVEEVSEIEVNEKDCKAVSEAETEESSDAKADEKDCKEVSEEKTEETEKSSDMKANEKGSEEISEEKTEQNSFTNQGESTGKKGNYSGAFSDDIWKNLK